MKAELTINTEELINEIVQRVTNSLKPLLKCKEEKEVIFDVPGLAKYLNVDESWVYKQVSSETIPYFKAGKYTRFKKSVIDKWIDKETVRPTRRL